MLQLKELPADFHGAPLALVESVLALELEVVLEFWQTHKQLVLSIAEWVHAFVHSVKQALFSQVSQIPFVAEFLFLYHLSNFSRLLHRQILLVFCLQLTAICLKYSLVFQTFFGT